MSQSTNAVVPVRDPGPCLAPRLRSDQFILEGDVAVLVMPFGFALK